jgi:FkbM family methyltransferase
VTAVSRQTYRQLARGVALHAAHRLRAGRRRLDERVMDALVPDTAVGHLSADAFPEQLDPVQVREVETKIGQMYVHAADEIMTPHIESQHEWEPAEMDFVRSHVRAGDTMLDVGANIGWFSVFGATLVGSEGRVIAVEPERRNLALLRANVWLNGCSNVSLLPVAAGSRRGFVGLQRNELNRGDHQVGLVGEEVHDLVPIVRLDQLLSGVRLDFVKIDTQGFDHEAIAGLAGCLAASSPTILCEFWPAGLARRGVDALAVAEGYLAMGLSIELLDDSGRLTPASPPEVVSTALSDPDGYRNLVLRRSA